MIFHSAKDHSDYSDYSGIGSTDQLIAMAQTAERCGGITTSQGHSTGPVQPLVVTQMVGQICRILPDE